MEFVDRLLTCVDCGGEFIFTAGEQLFFMDKQFKNDPKRCKPCKSRRSATAAGAAAGSGPAAAGISRTETRTECSECGVSTTVPFKPTQGRPVLCRQCFKNKRTGPAINTDTLATTVPSVTTTAPTTSASAGVPSLVPPAVTVAAESGAGELMAQPSSAA
jgi:CxxC-x17-CxxC domain-containing protein